MAKNGRYLVGQKFTNEQMEVILYGYAAWATPAEVMKIGERHIGKPISAKAVYNIFSLTRKRLLALNVFPDPARYYEYWRDLDNMRSFEFSKTAHRLGVIFEQFQGISDANYYEVVAESIYRAENPEAAGDQLFYLIKEAAKITGPFNRPPTNMQIWGERAYIRMLQKFISDHRKRGDDFGKRQIPSLQKHIIEKEKELDRMLRAGARIKAPRPRRPRHTDGLSTAPGMTTVPDDAPPPTSDRIGKPERP